MPDRANPGHAGELAPWAGRRTMRCSAPKRRRHRCRKQVVAGTTCRMGVLAAGTFRSRASYICRNRSRAALPRLPTARQFPDRSRPLRENRSVFRHRGWRGSMPTALTPSWMKHRLGVLAYVIMGTRAAVRAVWRRDFVRARVTVDGVTQGHATAAAVMVVRKLCAIAERITLGEGFAPTMDSRRLPYSRHRLTPSASCGD